VHIKSTFLGQVGLKVEANTELKYVLKFSSYEEMHSLAVRHTFKIRLGGGSGGGGDGPRETELNFRFSMWNC